MDVAVQITGKRVVKEAKNSKWLFLYYQVKQKYKKENKIMAKLKLVKANEKIAESVVGGYKKIEEGVVGGFNKMADKFVDNFLTKEGESVEEAKERLAAEQKRRKAGLE